MKVGIDEIRKRSLLTVFCAVMCLAVLFLVGCSSSSSNEQDYADDEVIGAISDGLEKRWDVNKQYEADGTSQSSESFDAATQAELEVISDFRNRQYEDSMLQEAVVSYINKLEEMKQLVADYPFDSDEFYEGWSKAYDERLVMLKNFVDNYNLTVDASYEEELSEIMTEANLASQHAATDEAINGLINSLVFEQVNEGYGYYTYSATAQNSSDYSFSNVSLILALYDEDGVMAQETYAVVNSWPSGETVKFEAGGDIDTSQIKVTLEYYETVE